MDERIVKVGFGQIGNPTPLFLKYIFRIYTFLAGLWPLLSPQFTHIPKDIIAEVTKWLLVGVPIMHYTIKFFGLDYAERYR